MSNGHDKSMFGWLVPHIDENLLHRFVHKSKNLTTEDQISGRRHDWKKGRGKRTREVFKKSLLSAKQPRNINLYLPSIVYNKTTPTSAYFYPIKFKFVDAILIIHATKHADTLTNTIFSIISIHFVNKPVQSVKLSISWVESYG